MHKPSSPLKLPSALLPRFLQREWHMLRIRMYRLYAPASRSRGMGGRLIGRPYESIRSNRMMHDAYLGRWFCKKNKIYFPKPAKRSHCLKWLHWKAARSFTRRIFFSSRIIREKDGRIYTKCDAKECCMWICLSAGRSGIKSRKGCRQIVSASTNKQWSRPAKPVLCKWITDYFFQKTSFLFRETVHPPGV